MFFYSSNTEKARSVASLISSRYGIKEVANPGSAGSSIVLALGGDGFMLETLHKTITTQTHIYGINCGYVGFLLNQFRPDYLLEDVKTAEVNVLPVLTVEMFDEQGNKTISNSINDFYLLRSQAKAAKLEIIVDGKILAGNFIGDGVIVSTPTGSTAYNSAAGGAVLALNSQCIVLTGINSYKPRHFKSLVLSQESIIEIRVHSHEKRPVIATSDAQLFHGITRARIFLEKNKTVSVLFSKKESLHEKIISAQFS